MSINLDNVKAIVHNNKNVVKIEDSHGIVWQAPPSEEWHTVWEGSITKNANGASDSGYTGYTNIVNPGLTGEHQVRFYFSAINASASGGSSSRSYTYYPGGSTTKPTSPVEKTINFDNTYSSVSSILGASGYASDTYSEWGYARTSRQVYITYNPTNGFRAVEYYQTKSGGTGSVSASMTITKIEVLY